MPAGQGVHTAFCVAVQVPPQEKPAWQDWQVLHAVPLVPAWNLPTSHPRHACIPVPVLYAPGWHCRHSRSAVARQESPW